MYVFIQAKKSLLKDDPRRRILGKYFARRSLEMASVASSGRTAWATARHVAEAFEITARNRFTNRQYDRNIHVPASILRRILELGQIAPTSFNLQPYQYLVVRSPESKDLLASAMIGNNARIITETSLSIAFLAENGKNIITDNFANDI